MTARHPNRLIDETSPYLLQHAHNPVDWYTWGDAALAAARKQDKPILLSVGYSSCHWCHVMERESFENEETAGLMNELFVNIKVDREERPDLDAIYMDYVQSTTGSGGWPLTVFLTPDQTPFFGGTYFPPQSAHGRPAFPDVLRAVARAYRERKAEIAERRQAIRIALGQSAQFVGGKRSADESVLNQGFESLARQFDNSYGGFGEAPKFPNAMALGFLLRYHRRVGSRRALEMVEQSLQAMARGGIYDQLGGGFHRYAVDARWLVPHFEKMLYDNALLARLYTEAYQATGDGWYRRIAEETLDYIARDLLQVSGGFFSAQDADSEGEEGSHYRWSWNEVREVLGGEEAQVFADYFDVTEEGNFEGRNVLRQRGELRGVARSLGLSPEELEKRLDMARHKLFLARQKRPKPGLDDKILCAWNALAVTAFAEAGFAFDNRHYLDIASANGRFLTSHLWREGRLRRTWKGGQARLNAYLDDYAFLIEGLLALYQASGDREWLLKADDLMRIQIERFSDAESGDFYFTAEDHEALLVRRKEYLDNAIPSGNSASCLNLIRLAELLGREDYRRRAESVLERLTEAMARHPLGFGYWLQALDYQIGPIAEIAIVGPPEQREELLAAIRRRYLPNKALAIETGALPSGVVRLLEGRTTVGGRATAYVCRNYSCRRPVTSASDLEAILTEVDAARP
jgi:uncharacterized protein YyaL (SSP411 family)